MWAYDLMRSSGESNCCWSLCVKWFNGCRSCRARDVPTRRALHTIMVKIRKLGMLKPAASAP
eukprot:6560204-Pyramimonas_sp.AAC.1